MAYLSVLRKKERRLVGFSRISSFMPVTEKEIFVRMCFQFGESHTHTRYFCGKSANRVVGSRGVTSYQFIELYNDKMVCGYKWFSSEDEIPV